MKVALLITTFNRPDALDVVLRSVVNQSRIPDQVIVSDDGSSQETVGLVNQWMKNLQLGYVWQPNLGFRAARSRNLGVCKVDAEYLICIDGDCLLPPNFVENHLRLAKPGYMVAGGRHLLSESDTCAMLCGAGSIESAFWHWKFRSVPLGPFRDLTPIAWETVRTSNLSVYLRDATEVYGFDESYVGWGREDSDFVVRLMRHGIKVRSGRLAACVAHLHHAERPRDQLSENDTRFHTCLNDPAHILASSSVLAES